MFSYHFEWPPFQLHAEPFNSTHNSEMITFYFGTPFALLTLVLFSCVPLVRAHFDFFFFSFHPSLILGCIRHAPVVP